jgi:EpsI family protein
VNGSRRDFLVAAGCGATALAAGLASARGRQAAQGLPEPIAELVPGRLGPWTVEPNADILIPRGDAGDVEVYDELLTRVYVHLPAAPVMLVVAYGSSQAGTTQLHRPEVCYPAAGFQLQNRPELRLPLDAGGTLAARTMTATNAERVEQILYWSRVGRDFPTGSATQRWSLLRQSFSGTVPDGALVRMSTITNDYRAAMAILLPFARTLLALPGPARQLLTGRA